MLIREGVHSRLQSDQFNTKFQQWDALSNRQQRLAYVFAAVANKNAEYEGCTRLRRKRGHRRTGRIKTSYRYRDCVHYFEEVGNGFDLIF